MEPLEGDTVSVCIKGKVTSAVVLKRTGLQLRVQHEAGTVWVAVSEVVSVPAPAAAPSEEMEQATNRSKNAIDPLLLATSTPGEPTAAATGQAKGS